MGERFRSRKRPAQRSEESGDDQHDDDQDQDQEQRTPTEEEMITTLESMKEYIDAIHQLSLVVESGELLVVILQHTHNAQLAMDAMIVALQERQEMRGREDDDS